MSDFSTRLNYLRELHNLSQRQLSKKSGIVRSCISKMESGQIMPSASNLIKLADFFHVSIDWLLSRTPFAKSPNPVSVEESQAGYAIAALDAITTDEIQVLKLYRKLSPQQKEEVLSFLEFKANK